MGLTTIGLVALAANLVTNALKIPFVVAKLGRIPDKFKSWIALGLAVLAGVVIMLVKDSVTAAGIMDALNAGALAITGHALLSTLTGRTEEIQAAKDLHREALGVAAITDQQARANAAAALINTTFGLGAPPRPPS